MNLIVSVKVILPYYQQLRSLHHYITILFIPMQHRSIFHRCILIINNFHLTIHRMDTIHHPSMLQAITILPRIFEYFLLVFRIANANKKYQSMKEDFHT